MVGFGRVYPSREIIGLVRWSVFFRFSRVLADGASSSSCNTRGIPFSMPKSMSGYSTSNRGNDVVVCHLVRRLAWCQVQELVSQLLQV